MCLCMLKGIILKAVWLGLKLAGWLVPGPGVVKTGGKMVRKGGRGKSKDEKTGIFD